LKASVTPATKKLTHKDAEYF